MTRLVLAGLLAVAACGGSTPPASSVSGGPAGDAPHPIAQGTPCDTDDDCADGESCQEEIEAACETCDGGELVLRCHPAD